MKFRKTTKSIQKQLIEEEAPLDKHRVSEAQSSERRYKQNTPSLH